MVDDYVTVLLDFDSHYFDVLSFYFIFSTRMVDDDVCNSFVYKFLFCNFCLEQNRKFRWWINSKNKKRRERERGKVKWKWLGVGSKVTLELLYITATDS